MRYCHCKEQPDEEFCPTCYGYVSYREMKCSCGNTHISTSEVGFDCGPGFEEFQYLDSCSCGKVRFVGLVLEGVVKCTVKEDVGEWKGKDNLFV